jgi:hypothetical protein
MTPSYRSQAMITNECERCPLEQLMNDCRAIQSTIDHRNDEDYSPLIEKSERIALNVGRRVEDDSKNIERTS